MGLFLKKRVEMPDKIILGNTEFVFDRKLGFHVGEWTVWDRKTKILLEFQSTEGNIGDIVLEKVNWVNDHKDTIIRAFLDENDDCIDVVNEMIEDGTLEADGKISEDEFVKALFVNNVTIFVNGSETGFYMCLSIKKSCKRAPKKRAPSTPNKLVRTAWGEPQRTPFGALRDHALLQEFWSPFARVGRTKRSRPFAHILEPPSPFSKRTALPVHGLRKTVAFTGENHNMAVVD